MIVEVQGPFFQHAGLSCTSGIAGRFRGKYSLHLQVQSVSQASDYQSADSPPRCSLLSWFAYSLNLKMEIIRTFETSVNVHHTTPTGESNKRQEALSRTNGLLSESELLYDRRFTANHFTLATNPLRVTTSNFIFQLNACGYSPYVTFSLTRGWICRLQLLLILASAVILRFESRETHDHMMLSHFRDSPNLEGKVPVFISTRNRVARLYPQALGSLFVASYDSLGYGGGIRPRLHTGLNSVDTARTI
jgi:hypothetical protein